MSVSTGIVNITRVCCLISYRTAATVLIGITHKFVANVGVHIIHICAHNTVVLLLSEFAIQKCVLLQSRIFVLLLWECTLHPWAVLILIAHLCFYCWSYHSNRLHERKGCSAFEF